MFDGLEVIQVFDYKYLGFHLDVKLNFKRNCETLSSKIARGVGFLRILKQFLPLSALENIYYALIHSYITYGCSIYACNFESNFKKVRVMQNKVLRILG